MFFSLFKDKTAEFKAALCDFIPEADSHLEFPKIKLHDLLRLFSKSHKANLQTLIQTLNSPLLPFQTVRLLLFLHLVINRYWDNDQVLQEMREMNINLQCSPHGLSRKPNPTTTAVYEQFVKPFFKYVKKVCFSSELYGNITCKQVRVFSLTDLVQQVARSINLLKSLASLNKFMRTFGRLYLRKFGVMFNVFDSVSQELSMSYGYVKSSIQFLVKKRQRLSADQMLLLLQYISQVLLINDCVCQIIHNRHYKQRIQKNKISFKLTSLFEEQKNSLVLHLMQHKGNQKITKKLLQLKNKYIQNLQQSRDPNLHDRLIEYVNASFSSPQVQVGFDS